MSGETGRRHDSPSRPLPRRYSTVAVGDRLGPLTRSITRVTLFLFGVSYFTAHRIHYDVEYSRGEGFDDVLVTANLLSAYSAELVASWVGDPQALKSLEERNVSPAVAGDVVVVSGRVVELESGEEEGLVWCTIDVRKTDGTVIVEGRASVALSNRPEP